METLYVIGNGFDKHHQIDTDYSDYRQYVADEYPELIDTLEQYYDVSEESKLWSYFEEELASFDPELLLEEFNDGYYEPDCGSDDFSDGDWDNYQVEIELRLDPLKTDLQESFTTWINSRTIPANINDFKIDIDTDSYFLTFNYTDVLERIYNVDQEHITYIHGKVGNGDLLVFGHALEPGTWRNLTFKAPEMPDDLDEEAQQEWEEVQAAGYSLAKTRGIDEIESFFSKIHKNTREIIRNHRNLFNEMSTLNRVIVLGHSLSEVDIPYFEEIIRCAKPTQLQWTVSYYGDGEKRHHEFVLKELGIPKQNIELIELNSLLLKQTKILTPNIH